MARPAHDVADHQRVKQVRVAPRWRYRRHVRAEWFVVTTPDAAVRDEAVRERRIEHLRGLIDGSDAWPKTKRDEPGSAPCATSTGCAGCCAAPRPGCCAPPTQR